MHLDQPDGNERSVISRFYHTSFLFFTDKALESMHLSRALSFRMQNKLTYTATADTMNICQKHIQIDPVIFCSLFCMQTGNSLHDEIMLHFISRLRRCCYVLL